VTALRIATMVAQQMRTRLHQAFVVAVLQILIPTATALLIAMTTASSSQTQVKKIATATALVTHAISHLVKRSIAMATAFQTLAISPQAQAPTAIAMEFQTNASQLQPSNWLSSDRHHA